VGKLKIKQDGFTIIELMVVLVILLIVISLGYMFFDFGIRAFNRGEQRAIAQQATRTASSFISSEMRYASHITINPPAIDTSDDDYSYIYQNGQSVYFQDKDKSIPARILLDSSADQIAYSITFNEDLVDPTHPVIEYILEAENIYTLTSNVFILNLANKYHYIRNPQTDNITGIKYKKPF